MTSLYADAFPPGRHTEDRDTTTVLSGSKDRETVFTERWRMVLDGRDDTPWKIAGSTDSVIPRG